MPFSDTVATEYGVPNLCALTYSLGLSADAATFGVSILFSTPNYYLKVETTNQTLIGQTKSFTLSANATP